MKEQIYTIPVNEVYDTDCECPLCELEKKLEKETLDYALGAAMMEPEFRMESNEKGFCNHHCSMLFGMSNKLALSLVLDTHLEEIRKKLDGISDGCVVCDKINHTMERYADVLLYMWANDEKFKEKFNKSKGVCLKHMKLLVDTVPKSLKDSQAAQFLACLFEKQETELSRIQQDIHKFTLKFDYRNKDMEWGTAQDAPIRTIDKISGFINNDYEEK